jgi:hypothetical protein
MHVLIEVNWINLFLFFRFQALRADGIEYDSSTFKVLQYNPPYTVPWYIHTCIHIYIQYSAYIHAWHLLCVDYEFKIIS